MPVFKILLYLKHTSQGFPTLPSAIVFSQFCPSLAVIFVLFTFSLLKHLKLILYPSGKLLGIVKGEIPQILQNQCFAVPVLKVYSSRCSLPSNDFRDDLGIVKPRKPYMWSCK